MDRQLFMRFSLLAFMFLLVSVVMAQDEPTKVVQFSGRVVTADNGKIEKLIYVNVAVEGTPRGVNSDIDGFFSLPVREGETVLFSTVGYERKKFTIPSGIEGNMFSKDIIMKKDTLFLPEALIYPWPDKDYFKIEFLALDVSDVFEDIVAENLSPEKMQILREILPVDGGEVSKIELNRAAQNYYSEGQLKPQNIFNPLSWKKFIDALKRGDFKKKD